MKGLWLLSAALLFHCNLISQEDDLLDLLGEDETINYTTASFKTNRVINLHSLENTSKRVLDIKISHRLGLVSGGVSEMWGLDQASIRLGADYGITEKLMVGFGRSSFEKTFDGFIKYKFLRQSTGAKEMPVTLIGLSSMAVKSNAWPEPDRENFFSSRLYYSYQLIIGRKISKSFSMQLVPSMVHRNLVENNDVEHDVYALGGGARIKLSNRMTLNAEYIYVLPDQLADPFLNSASIGLDIETGGHVFQLHFTNSSHMNTKGVITETVDDWLEGDFRFGFNISRVFTIHKKEKPEKS